MKRLDFVRQKYNVLSNEALRELLIENGIGNPDPNVDIAKAMAYYVCTDGKTYFHEHVFQKLIDTDPTKNKQYVQWLMVLISHILKEENGDRNFEIFVTEDLPKTHESLVLFEANKRKKKFKELTAKNYALRNVKDATDINQYTSIAELYGAIFPFKKVIAVSDLEKHMEYYVSMGEGEIPVKDEKYTIFIPKSLRASELFSFTNWCTAVKGNGMFKRYTDDLRPDGSKSNLFIVIDNGFFEKKNDKIYQIHFETSQIMDKADKRFGGMSEIIKESLSVRNFFYETLYYLVRESYIKERNNDVGLMFGNSGSTYMRYALEFGFGEMLFDVMDDSTPTISLMDLKIPKLPSLARFNKLRIVFLDNIGLSSLVEDIFKSEELNIFSVPRNNISELPDSIGNNRNLNFLNLKGNPIQKVPDSIRYLDPINGGSLEKLSIDLDLPVVDRLKRLLPSVHLF